MVSELELQRNITRKVVAGFGVVCMLAGLLVAAGTVGVYFLGEKSRFWPETPGTVVSSKVMQYERGISGNTLSKSTVYEPEITYSYSLKNKKYFNDRVSFSPIGGGNRAPSQYYVSRFKIGGTYPVYYDPKNPETSTLVKGTSPLNVVAIFSGLVFFLFGLVFYKMRNVYANSVPDNFNEK